MKPVDSMGKHLSDHVGELGLADKREALADVLGGGSASASASTRHLPTVVVKVGTSSILRPDTGYLALSTLSTLVETLCKMRKDGHRVVLVSSGAVGVGCQRLGIKERPSGIAELQALAAVGQPHLMRYYEGLFHALHQPIAQVLLTAETLGTRAGYQNSQATFEALFKLGVIPVVNENDTVAVRELRFGDNDTLSALVATLVNADHLFLATDVDALYTSNPFAAPKEGEPPPMPMHVVPDVNEVMHVAEGSDSQWGTGGMGTKLVAAQLAGAAGISTTIVHAQKPELIATILGGARDVCTTFLPLAKVCAQIYTACAQHAHSVRTALIPLPCSPRRCATSSGGSSRCRRAASCTSTRARPARCAGARRSSRRGSRRTAWWATSVRTRRCVSWTRRALTLDPNPTPNSNPNPNSDPNPNQVRLMDETGVEFGRGVVNYSADQARKLCGCSSDQVAELLGYNGPDGLTSELVSRQSLALTSPLERNSGERSSGEGDS